MEQQSPHADPREDPGATGTAPARPPRGSRARWLALPVVAATGLAITLAVMPPAPSEGSHAAAPSNAAVTAPTPMGAARGPAGSPSAPPATQTGTTAPPADASSAPTGEPGPSTASDGSEDSAASRPTGLTFPAASIDTAVLPLTPTQADHTAQQLVPPLTPDAYWLTSYGTPGAASADTTYIVGHSWEGRDAPFNRLSDESLVGAEFTITTPAGDIPYVVESVVTHDKDTLKDSDIWDIAPHRVVLISCYTEDPWGRNVVVTALPKAS